MTLFRKNPTIIEAFQLGGDIESVISIIAWIKLSHVDAYMAHGTNPFAGIYIKTLEGTMLASPGDWIIKGVRGEFYPCKEDIFHLTYEEVEE